MNDDLVSQLLREKRAREQGADQDVRSPYEPLRVPERSAPRSAGVPAPPMPSPPTVPPGPLQGMPTNVAPPPAAPPMPPGPPPAPAASAAPPLREPQPTRRLYDAPRAASGQPTAAEETLKLLIGVGGAAQTTLSAAAPIVGRLLKTVDWVKVLQAVEEGMRAKQERAIYRAVAITWEEFGICTDFVVQLLRDADKLDKDVLDKVIELFKGERPAWYFSSEKKHEICRDLLPKLAQIQSVLGRARRHADDGVTDEAQKDLEHLAALLKNVRAYFSAVTAM